MGDSDNKHSFQSYLQAGTNINSFMTESLSYRNQSIDLNCKSMDWFLYDRDLCHKGISHKATVIRESSFITAAITIITIRVCVKIVLPVEVVAT